MGDALDQERLRIEKAIRDEFETGPQTLERLEEIAPRHCGDRWKPTCMPVVGGGFDVAVLLRRPYPASGPSDA